MFELTKYQKKKYDHICRFLISKIDVRDPKTYLQLLIGYAGVGKSTLIKYTVESNIIPQNRIICVAPTHKARKILQNLLPDIQTTTLASFLSKKPDGRLAAKKNFIYENSLDNKDKNLVNGFIIIDEASMIDNYDFDKIVEYARLNLAKVLFVGDNLQLPSPGQRLSVEGEYMVKSHSNVFSLENIIVMKKIVRQSTDNPLVKEVCDKIRQNIDSQIDLYEHKTIINHKENTGVVFVNDQKEFDASIVKTMTNCKELNKIRVLSYTNKKVGEYNKLIRSGFGYQDTFVKGELLTGYNTLASYSMRKSPNLKNITPIIENGQDYIIEDLKYMTNYKLSTKALTQSNLAGYLLTLRLIDVMGSIPNRTIDLDNKSVEGYETTKLFIVDVKSKNNTKLLESLTRMAIAINKSYTKDMYVKYMSIRNKIAFSESIYHFRDKILNDIEFKKLYPELFTKINKPPTKNNDSRGDNILADAFPEINNIDYNKMSSDDEYKDWFRIIEKDIDYGYSITIHKSQGSTYDIVFLDEKDTNIIKDKWNHTYGKMENRSRERNKLKYVAFSRAKNMVISLY